VSPELAALVHQRFVEASRTCYPSALRRYHQTGEAELQFCVDAAGQVEHPVLSHSSGVPALDEAALGCVLANVVPLPPETGGVCFTVPVRFR
jgi:TonB family protein